MNAITTTTVSPVAKATSAKNCVKLIREAAKAQGTMQDRFQTAALAVMSHAQSFDDCDLAKTLCRALNPHQRNSLVGWFMMFSPIGVLMGKTTNEDKARFIKKDSKAYNDFNLDGAAANPWFTDPANANPEPKPLGTYGSFWDAIIGMVLKEKKAAETDGDKAKYTPEDRAAIIADANDISIILGVARAKSVAAKAANTNTTGEEVQEEPLSKAA